MRSYWLLIPSVASLCVACHQPTRPAKDASAAPTVTASAAPKTDATEVDTQEPSASADEASISSAPHDAEAQPPASASVVQVALPPSDAKSWDTSQSDGKPAHHDRGIKDYAMLIKTHRAMFRNCYEKSLAKHPGIRGRVVLKFKLDPKGKVSEAAIDPSGSDITEKELGACMSAAIKSLKFPPSRRGMESTVRYPFQFNPHASRR